MTSSSVDRPAAMDAQVEILFTGYAHAGEGGFHVAGTVGFVRDGAALIVMDPGMVPFHRSILEPLTKLGWQPEAVTDVVFSHHHPDHTLSAALFPNARFHDHWAIYEGDLWTARRAEGFAVSPSVLLIETPGHTPQDITTLVGTADGIVAFTHLWTHAEATEDPLATDPAALHAGRRRVAGIATRIVPGHGAPFDVAANTPM